MRTLILTLIFLTGCQFQAPLPKGQTVMFMKHTKVSMNWCEGLIEDQLFGLVRIGDIHCYMRNSTSGNFSLGTLPESVLLRKSVTAIGKSPVCSAPENPCR